MGFDPLTFNFAKADEVLQKQQGISRLPTNRRAGFGQTQVSSAWDYFRVLQPVAEAASRPWVCY
jgi:hypothetical protein